MMAGTATEFLQGRASRRNKPFVAAGPVATDFFGIWLACIALATFRGARLVRHLALPAALAIPLALHSPACFAVIGGPVAAVGFLLRPLAGGVSTIFTAIPRKRMSRMEAALTALEQTNSAPAPIGGLIRLPI